MKPRKRRPMSASRTPEMLLQWLFSNCVPTPMGCMELQFLKNKEGYHTLCYKGLKTTAHRMVARIVYGDDVMSGKLACHICDNRACINPAHLYPGTPTENLDDAYRRNRRKKPSAELT